MGNAANRISRQRKVSADGNGNITQSTRLAPSARMKQNGSLNTSDSGVDFHSREIGAPWHPTTVGVSQILGLQGMKLTNNSHMSLGMDSFRSKSLVERTPVTSAHTSATEQVLPPGPVDATVDFEGLRGELTTTFPKTAGKHGSGLASIDIRDIMRNKRNYNDWPRHGGVDPSGSIMSMSTPPYYETIPYGKVAIKQQYPKKVSKASAQGFFSD